MPSLLAGSRFGQGDEGGDYEDYLAALMALLEERSGAREVSSFTDPTELMKRFRNEGYQPRATGVPYIFTGGSPFPMSEGQVRGGDIAATGAFAGNMLDSIGNVLPAILDALNRRKNPKQGGKV